ncbi:MAG TPA: LysM peptidoglycan-binding domain-containing protein [Gemmatimonadales bacterium]|jgi:membrane-bound lytic murein transglycosylase D|nr:LysM peptidoglycan-binding domain-containing protein [Gemmatimonadales bacterium]
MNRVPFLALLLVAACAPAAGSLSEAGPAPEVRDESTTARAEPSSSATQQVISSNARPVSAEVDADVESAADSAADAEVLEQLATAHPAGGDDDGSGGTASVTWDIDVTSFNNHDRVQYYLDFFTGPGRSRMEIWLERLPKYEGMIRSELAANELPEDLVYLALIESGFSNRAVSRARAVGMWQFMAPTGRGYGLRIDSWVDDRRDPVKATSAAARYLKDLRDRFGSPYLAAAAYNAGAGRVGRGLARLDDGEDDDSLYSDATFFKLYNTSLLRRETKDYVPKLIAAALIAKEPSKYGFTVDSTAEPFRADSITVPDMTGLDVIAQLADTTMAAIRDLNPEYLRLVTPPRTRSIVLVPPGRGDETQSAFDSLPESAYVSFRKHVVGKSESVASIARHYGITTDQLYEANPGRKGHVRAGQTLLVPADDAMSVVVAHNVAEPAAPEVRIHKVRSGETLSGIAVRYHVSVAQLQRWNRLRSSRIRIGQRLRIGETTVERASRVTPRRSAAPTHVVRAGETLIGVAHRYGVSLSALSSANGLSTRAHLRIGQRLKIPG